MRVPSRPNSVNNHPNQVKNDPKAAEAMRKKGVFYLHGGDIRILHEVAEHGLILSAKDRDTLNEKDSQVEEGFTQAAILNQRLREGISLFSVELCNKAKHYTTRGHSIPIIFGIDPKVELAPAHIIKAVGHDLTVGSITIQHIKRIYIPDGQMESIRRQLATSKGKYMLALARLLEENARVMQKPAPSNSRKIGF